MFVQPIYIIDWILDITTQYNTIVELQPRLNLETFLKV